MNTIKLKTNIACVGCKSKVAKVLDNDPKIKTWDVDLVSAERWLTAEVEDVDESYVKAAVAMAGYVCKD